MINGNDVRPVALSIKHPLRYILDGTKTSQKDSNAEGIDESRCGSRCGPKKAPEREVNHSIFSTVGAGTAGISFKMYVDIRHL